MVTFRETLERASHLIGARVIVPGMNGHCEQHEAVIEDALADGRLALSDGTHGYERADMEQVVPGLYRLVWSA
jgi:hypothetical protein